MKHERGVERGAGGGIRWHGSDKGIRRGARAFITRRAGLAEAAGGPCPGGSKSPGSRIRDRSHIPGPRETGSPFSREWFTGPEYRFLFSGKRLASRLSVPGRRNSAAGRYRRSSPGGVKPRTRSGRSPSTGLRVLMPGRGDIGRMRRDLLAEVERVTRQGREAGARGGEGGGFEAREGSWDRERCNPGSIPGKDFPDPGIAHRHPGRSGGDR